MLNLSKHTLQAMKKDELVDYIFELYDYIEKLPKQQTVKNNDAFENIKKGSEVFKVKEKLVNKSINFKVSCGNSTYRGSLKLSAESAVIKIGNEKLVVNLSKEKIMLINTFDEVNELLMLNVVQPIVTKNCNENLSWSVES